MKNFRLDTKDIDNLMSSLDPKLNQEAFRITANEVAFKAINLGVKALSKSYGIKYKRRGRSTPIWDIEKAGTNKVGTINMVKASSKSNIIYVNFSSRTLPLSLFDTQFKNIEAFKNDKSKEKRKSASIKVVKTKRATRLKAKGITKGKEWAILRLTMKNGHRGIFIREKGKLRELRTLSPTMMYNDTGNILRNTQVKQIEDFVNDAWNESHGEAIANRYAHNLKYILKKAGVKF